MLREPQYLLQFPSGARVDLGHVVGRRTHIGACSGRWKECISTFTYFATAGTSLGGQPKNVMFRQEHRDLGLVARRWNTKAGLLTRRWNLDTPDRLTKS